MSNKLWGCVDYKPTLFTQQQPKMLKTTGGENGNSSGTTNNNQVTTNVAKLSLKLVEIHYSKTNKLHKITTQSKSVTVVWKLILTLSKAKAKIKTQHHQK